MKKVIIFGSNGLLGQNLVERFCRTYQVIGASKSNMNLCIGKNMEYQQIDMVNRTIMNDFLNLHKPDIIINAAAYSNVDKCETEKEECWNTNVRAVENIIDFTQKIKTILVQISTDYVFDGQKGWYRESDKPNPKGNYARSKFAAENIISESKIEHIIARTQILYGIGNNVKQCFPVWVLEQLKKKEKINVVHDQIGNPTITDDLSEAIFRLLEQKEFGLYHISGKEVINRYEFALKIAGVFSLDSALIEKISSGDLKQIAQRPQNSSFIIDKLVNKIDWEPGDVSSGLKRLKIMMNE
jgi:dTDP-4-dehydrorhamnose reductase